MLSLIVPVYKNEASLPDLLRVVQELYRQRDGRMELVVVIDGSPDQSYEWLRAHLPGSGLPATLVLLSRNFGSFAAIREGLLRAQGSTFAVMAADLQEPPELVVQMQRCLESDEADVVVGVRERRDDPLLSRLPASIFWGLYRRFVVHEMPPGGVDIFGCNKEFRDQLLKLGESRSSLVAQLFWLGFRRREIGYVRRAREHGLSAWTLRKKLAYLSDSVFAFTDLPIRWLIRFGALGAMLAAIVGASAAIGRLLGWVQVPGYAMTILVIAFFGALNLLGLGIVGNYAWRAYENSKARPLAVTLREHRF